MNFIIDFLILYMCIVYLLYCICIVAHNKTKKDFKPVYFILQPAAVQDPAWVYRMIGKE